MEANPVKILVLYGSTRRGGNSDQLAGRLVAGLPRTEVYLSEKQIKPIVDQRHDPQGFTPVDDDYDAIVQQVLEHDVLLFATPLYWYGMSAPMKLFVDRWSQSLRDKRYDFKAALRQKRAFVVVTGGDNPRIKGLPLIQQFTYIFDFVGMPFAGYVIGEGNKPGDVLLDERALDEVRWLRNSLQSMP